MGSSYSCPEGYMMIKDAVYRSTVRLCIQRQPLLLNGISTNYTFITDIIPASQQSTNPLKPDPETLALGLGLGFGIPAFIILICILVRLYDQRQLRKYEKQLHNRSRFRTRNEIEPLQANDQVHIDMPLETAERELTPDALRDFRAGVLSNKLMQELMVLRIKKGQNLTTYVQYADICHQPQVADWVYRLNPGEIPREIREIANRKV